MSKTTPKKPVMPQLSYWWRGWTNFLKSRVPQLGSRFVGCFGMSALITFALVVVLYFWFLAHSKSLPQDPQTLEWWTQVIMFGILFYAFIGALALLFILSLHPKTRKVADKLIGFIEKTELEKLKVRVDTIESGLASTNERIDRLDKRLDDVESRLGNIETTLKRLANKER